MKEIIKKQGETVILGSGISGLYTGYRLAEKGGCSVTLLEKTGSSGGMAKSFKYGEHTLDFGPHKIYSVLPGIMDEYQRIMDNALLTVKKTNSIFLQGKRIEFPIKPFALITQIRIRTLFLSGVGFCIASIENIFRKRKIQTYEDYFVNGFGVYAYNLIFRDLALKVWGDPKLLTEELARKRVPVPNIFRLVGSIFSAKPKMSAKEFLYPKNGFGSVAETLSKKIKNLKGTVHLQSIPTRIVLKKNHVESVTYKKNEKTIIIKNPERVISTIHILDLLNMITPRPPKEIFEASGLLQFRGLMLIYLFFDQERVLKENWIFFPEKKFIFNRVSEPKLSSSHVSPEGKTYIIAEVTLDSSNPLYENEKEVVERVITDLEKSNILHRSMIVDFIVKKARRIYPVYDLEYRKNLGIVMDYVDTIHNLYSIGRPGLFNYNNTDHCIDTGMKLADCILSEGSKKDWKKSRESFDQYSIVD